MKPDAFLKMLGRKDIFYIAQKDYDCRIDMLMERIQSLSRLTEYIDFGCRFDSKGKCNTKNNYKSKRQCCCVECLDRIGYLDIVSEDDLNYYAKKWSIRTGFWRKGKGCILDRWMRSSTCVTFACYSVSPDKNLKTDLDTLAETIRHLQYEIKHWIWNTDK